MINITKRMGSVSYCIYSTFKKTATILKLLSFDFINLFENFANVFIYFQKQNCAN